MASSDRSHTRHSPYEFDAELRRQFESLRQEAASDLRVTVEEVQAALDTALGRDAASAFRAEFDRDRDTFGNSFVAATEAPPSLRIEATAISLAQIDRWCALLGLSTDARSQFDQAFARYQHRIEELAAAESQSKVKWLAAESALNTMHKLDADLFESIQEICAQPEVAAIASAIQSTRARQVLWHGVIRARWAANGDIGEIVLEASIPTDELLGALPSLQEYNDQILPVLTGAASRHACPDKACRQWSGASAGNAMAVHPRHAASPRSSPLLRADP
jgi:hypothetical protein